MATPPLSLVRRHTASGCAAVKRLRHAQAQATSGERNDPMPAGRPLEYDPEQVLTAAMELFWERGFEAAALPALLSATHLSRSSLYRAFGSKQALFERCLEHYQARVAAGMANTLQAAPSGWAFLSGVLDGIVNERSAGARRRGCLTMNTAREFKCRDARICRIVNASVERMTGIFADAVRRAQAEGDIPQGSDPRALAAFFLTGVRGLRTLL